MNREDALAKADSIITAWITPPTNSRGYPVDGWKPPALADRTNAVEQLARFLMESEPVRPVNRLVPPRTTLFGWPIDGMDGPPSLQQYRAAREVQRAWRADPDGIHSVAEASALNLLIEAFEESAPQAMPPPETP